jgi:low affinity Fe/Cu permease
MKFKEGWQKTANTIVLSVMTLIITTGVALMVDNTKSVSKKLDELVIQTTINSMKLEAHNEEAGMWKNRIQALEEGKAEATMDRITKGEALDAIEDLKKWVDRYYERKR